MVAPLRPGETALGGRQKGDGYAAVGRSTSQAWFGSGFSNAPVTCWCRNGEIDLGEVENTSMGEASSDSPLQITATADLCLFTSLRASTEMKETGNTNTIRTRVTWRSATVMDRIQKMPVNAPRGI